MKKNRVDNPLKKYENEIKNLDLFLKKEKLILLKNKKLKKIDSSFKSYNEMKISLQKLVKEMKNKKL